MCSRSKNDVIGLSVIAIFCLATVVQAAEVQLAWDPPADTNSVAGYKVYYGLGSGDYSDLVDVGNVLATTISGLQDATTYYFGATAYNILNDESGFSVEFVWDKSPPSITGLESLLLNADPQASVPDLTDDVAVNDDCSAVPSIALTQSPAAGTVLPGGVTVVTVTATDEAGNSTDWPVDVTVNTRPSVEAGPDQTVSWPARTVALDGTVTDDGFPQGTPLSIAWTVVSGPGTVTFSNPGTAESTATFSMPGTYVIRLTAGDGELSAFDELTVQVDVLVPNPPTNLRVI